ncbi:MAG: TetR/AcrR family transcriptional regulator [Ellagibacter isourolithinifaciens]|nr:TetR/AcrR family transcriptional regulator [Ellagibacter isourolithinifaciens]
MDKRVAKTKRTIKRTLVELLATMPFEKITVTELCRAADVSRITFYTYYDDKYALADELFRDDMAKAEERYRALQAENNPRKIPTNSYRNLLTCIFSVFEQRDGIFIHCSSTKNPYLHSACFNHVVRVVENYVQNHRNALEPKYPSPLTAALVCNGLFGMFSQCRAQGMSLRETKKVVFAAFDDLLNSTLFFHSALIG